MGAGMWGTTFAQVLCDAGTPAVLWGRRPELTEAINQRHENPQYLPGITLTSALRATSDSAAALDGADLVVLAVPAQTLRQNLASWAALLPPGVLLVSLMKGIEHGTHLRMSQVTAEVTGAEPDRIAVITGPNLARGDRHPSARGRRGRLHRRRHGQASAAGLPHAVLPALHQPGCDRL